MGLFKKYYKIKPDYFIHGDDWNFNGQIGLKYNAVKALKKYGGKLIEIEHTQNISSEIEVKHYRCWNYTRYS